MNQTHQFELPASTENGKARAASFSSIAVETTPTSLVGYNSLGQVVIIGPRQSVLAAADCFQDKELTCYLLATGSADTDDNPDRDAGPAVPETYFADEFSLHGHLGAFSVTASRNDRDFDFGKTVGLTTGKFDLALDLSDDKAIPAQIPPPGYFHIEPGLQEEKRFQQIADEMSQMVGSFEKPKFFNYDPDICAHSRSGITACTRCIDACPTDAIISIGEQIEVDSHLCQGGGICASACPTGAVTYAYPNPANQLELIRQVLLGYRKSGGSDAVMLFFDREQGGPYVESLTATLGENVLPVQVEEVGALGLDILASTLAYGAAGAGILCTNTAQSVRDELTLQISLLNEFIAGMGYECSPVQLLAQDTGSDNVDSQLQQLAQMSIESATFAATGIKRTDLRISLGHLHEMSPLKPSQLTLPDYSPFGEIKVDTDTCTLCMGCVAVCPASALEAGGDTPRLAFIENNCVQCGLCVSACPENSISKHPRYVFDTDARMRARTMNEDAPFHCRICGKPFATTAMLNRMKDKLKSHWMFQNPDAVARLEMCEDCRVKDMFAAEGGFPRHKI